MRYSDPSGHFACGDGIDDPRCEQYDPSTIPSVSSPSPTTNQPGDLSDWFSNKYGGCFKCHAAVANGQIALTNEQLAEIHHKMQKLMALGYSPMMALTLIFGTADIAPTVLQAIISGEAADCATDGDCAATRGLVVLGKYPKYLQVAGDVKGSVFQVSTEVWNSLTPEQQWELNKNFLDQAVKRGDYFYLASKWSEATGWYARELQYLFSLGYTMSPNQVWLIPPGN